MPSKKGIGSKQGRFFAHCATAKPSKRSKRCPSKKLSKEWHEADKQVARSKKRRRG